MYTSNGIPSGNCCTAELGTKIFAYFNLILTTMATVLSVVSFVYVVAVSLLAPEEHAEGFMIYATIIYCVFLFVSMFFSGTALVFAGFLMAGVTKKKPQYLDAYYVYGVVVTSLSLASTLCVMFSASNMDTAVSSAVIVICMLYCLVLAMIKATSKTYKNLNTQYEHKPLEDDFVKMPLP